MLGESQLAVWVDGGWGVDALVGRQTPPHEDRDLVIAARDCPAAQTAVAGLGYERDPAAEPGLPARVVLRGSARRQVDLHRVVSDARGDAWQPLGAGAWTAYPS